MFSRCRFLRNSDISWRSLTNELRDYFTFCMSDYSSSRFYIMFRSPAIPYSKVTHAAHRYHEGLLLQITCLIMCQKIFYSNCSFFKPPGVIPKSTWTRILLFCVTSTNSRRLHLTLWSFGCCFMFFNSIAYYLVLQECSYNGASADGFY